MNPLIFSYVSPYTPDFLEMRVSMFSSETYKDLSIKTPDSHLFKFHSLLLDDQELKTLADFLENTEEIPLPKEIPSKFIPEIINYFYFREIKSIALVEIFEFLRVVRFFHLDKLQNDIVVFIKEILKKKDKDISVFLLFNMLKYRSILDDQGIFEEIIHELIGFFKDNGLEDFLNIFRTGFLDIFGKKTIEVSREVIEIMRKIDFSNEQIFEFLMVFRENVKKLHLGLDFSEIIGESFNFPALKLQDLEKFTKDLGVLETHDLKFRLLNSHIHENEHNIVNLSKENSFLKQKIDQIQEEKNVLQQKLDDFINRSTKDLDDMKLKIKEIDLINHPFQVPEASDKLNLLLFKHFKQNLAKKVFFDSNIDPIDELSFRISGKKNLLFLFETKENMSFGVFFSIEMPTPFSDDKFYKDSNSFLFDLERNMVFRANEKEEKQLRTFKGYVYCVGDSKSGDGFEFKDLKTVMIGKRTEQFEGENLFGFEKREQKTLKRVLILKVFLEI